MNEYETELREKRQAFMEKSDAELPRGGNPIATLAFFILAIVLCGYMVQLFGLALEIMKEVYNA